MPNFCLKCGQEIETETTCPSCGTILIEERYPYPRKKYRFSP
ncbi:MAG: hypothetical protein ACTSW1_16145 [Candidatus Hodarchaeales archaeon]